MEGRGHSDTDTRVGEGRGHVCIIETRKDELGIREMKSQELSCQF